MYAIQQFTSAPLQRQNLILPDGTSVTITFYYMPLQLGWFIQEMVYGNFTLKGTRITISPNILYQFKNQLPFGLACFSKDNREPTQQEDFLSGYATLYLLSSAEVEEYSEVLSGQISS